MREIVILVFILMSFIGVSQTTYDIDTYNGQTITTCSGKFTDSRPGNSNYYDNEDYTITFCSGSSKLLKFNFGGSTYTSERIHSSDTLFIYDGPDTLSPLIAAVTGNPSNNYKLTYFGEHYEFVFLSPSSCITFRFVSDASHNENGWEAIISCVDPVSCNQNIGASDLFASAPYVCNLNGYCGITSSNFGPDFPTGLTGGGSCPTLFGGTIENNSWIKFQANASSVDFDFTVDNCLYNSGIQVAVFDYNGTTFTRMSDCALSDASHYGNFTVTASGLTVGKTYYIMVDGNAGDVCDYQINTSDSSSITTFSATHDSTICEGEIITLTAEAPGSGQTYSWTWDNGTGGPITGDSLDISPHVNTQYVVELTGSDCSNSTDTISVNVITCETLPISLSEFYCENISDKVKINWSTSSETNNNLFVLQKSTDAINFTDFAQVSGNNNSNKQINYFAFDNNPIFGTNYYRIKQVDYDGNYSVSDIISINISENLDENNIYYSKSQNSIKISFKENTEQSTILIYNMLGDCIYRQKYNPENNNIVIPLDSFNLNNEILIVKIENPTENICKKIIIR